MKYFSVPADFKKETIEGYYALNQKYADSKVLETYGQISVENTFESGRTNASLPQADYLDLKTYIEHSKKQGIDFSYTLNAPFMHNREFTDAGVKEIKRFLYLLYDCGVRNLTIALPSMMDLVKSMDVHFVIKVSTISQVTTPNKALYYKNKGVDRIVVDESINREFGCLKDIVDVFGDKVEIIANSLCHKECVFRNFHYNQTSGWFQEKMDRVALGYYTNRCALRIFEDVTNLMRLSWIRPEDLKYYTAVGINYFKLQGREYVHKGDPLRAIECYFQESYDGNLMELLDMFSPNFRFKFYIDNKKLNGFIKTFYENEGFCRKNCLQCKYCEGFLNQSVDIEQSKWMIEEAKKFNEKYDEYTKFVKSIEVNKQSQTGGKPAEIEIDFADL